MARVMFGGGGGAAGGAAGGANNNGNEWADADGDRYSFEDSDRFEEDSMCSWMDSEPESVYNNWRGWKKSTSCGNNNNSSNNCNSSGVYPIQSCYGHGFPSRSSSNGQLCCFMMFTCLIMIIIIHFTHDNDRR